MEKLLELLNEYDDWMVSKFEEYSEEFGGFILTSEQIIEEEIIISKSFGFIKWLVDNDKIDFTKLKVNYIYHDDEWSLEKELLMQLAIQDNPIEFLVSILR